MLKMQCCMQSSLGLPQVSLIINSNVSVRFWLPSDQVHLFLATYRTFKSEKSLKNQCLIQP